MQVTRDQFRTLAQAKLDDAKNLFDLGSWGNAYYLAGYAIEFGLKAVIASSFRENTLPDKNLVNSAYVHDIEKLVNTAGLTVALTQARQGDAALEINWAVVKDWSEQSRYEDATENEARELIAAIEDQQHGVLQWIAQHW
ncbi:HEPN domain-containing protein [Hyphomicrobium sp.]|uniref:HEPN domain-containing protein n=1 Tax=Hyphomicrobium sp. TaxID=82 RepID=UPI003F6FCB20